MFGILFFDKATTISLRRLFLSVVGSPLALSDGKVCCEAKARDVVHS